MLLFSDSTCSVQNLKTAVRTASAPENAFKTKENLQCVWKELQSEARPDSSHEAERRHVGAQRDKDFLRVSSEPLALVLSGRVGTDLSGCHTLADKYISHLPGVVVPLTGQRLEEVGRLAAHHVQDVLVGQRQVSPGFSQYTLPPPFSKR